MKVVDDGTTEAYEAILKSMGFSNRGGDWVLGLDKHRYQADELTVTLGMGTIELSIGGLSSDALEATEAKTLRMQGMYPQKLRREVNDMMTMIRSKAIAARIAREMIVAAGFTMGRNFYIPKNADNIEKVTPEGTDIEAYFYEQGGKTYGMAFSGKVSKPVWHYRFNSRAGFDTKLNQLVESRKGHLDFREQRRQERVNYKHGLKEGDILVAKWGYDQTNATWFEVIAVGEKSVKVREIGGKAVDGDKEVPVPGSFTGPVMNKIVGPGDSIRMSSYAKAYKWDGRPTYVTPFGMGH